MPNWSPERLAAELKWLQAHPEFEQRPATIREFVGEDYLNIEKTVRPAVMAELETIIGPTIRADRIAEYSQAIFTGGIGIGKTTIASIILPYLVHWVLCLKDPQSFFGLMPGSRIAFMQMSTSEKQALEVIFADVKARIEYSPWFQENYQFDPKRKNQLRFAKDIWILPGDSKETTFEGYNILGGILDEADSHQVTKLKDYAEQGYTTIYSRITSRFQDRGFLLIIGQTKRANGFAARKYDEFKKDPESYAVRMTIWESFGWERYTNADGTRDSFWYDPKRFDIIPSGAAMLLTSKDHLIEVPNLYKKDFLNNPGKALRDLAGIPPATANPFIPLVERIENCRDLWVLRNGEVSPVDARGNFEKWFRSHDPVKRILHLDMAYSGDGDGLGMAMGHVPEMVERDGEWKPFIEFDFLLRWQAPPGKEIFLGDVRRLIFDLKEVHKFRLKRVTMDGFQSIDTRQQLMKRRIESDLLSVDRVTAPYEELRDAIYEERVAFPPYMTFYRYDDTEPTEIAIKELSELVEGEKKVDHPENGSKDVADAMAGVVYGLMADRQFHRKRGMSSMLEPSSAGELQPPAQRISHPAFMDRGLQAPVPRGTGTTLWQPPSRR